MISSCQVTDQLFGVALIKSGSEVGARAEPERVGCTARMPRAARMPDGQLFILTVGAQRFRLLAPARAMPEGYPVGDGEIVDDEPALVVGADLLASVTA